MIIMILAIIGIACLIVASFTALLLMLLDILDLEQEDEEK